MSDADVGDAAPVGPRVHRTHVNGVDLAWYEWNEPASAATGLRETFLLVHATGFHARCWDRVVAELGSAHVVAVDMRGHGRSAKSPPFDWDTFGRDLAALVAASGWEGLVGVGHSMGGHSLVQAAAAHPDRFRRLVLVDPVIMAPELYAQHMPGEPGDHPTARRRNHWASWEEMRERFRHRAPFSGWDPRVLEDYCRHGVRPAPDGEGYVLACPPEVEAAIYTGSAGRDIHDLLPRIRAPVTVLRARERTAERDAMDFSSSPTWPELAARFPRGRDVHLREHSHFLPMEAPALVAEYVLGHR